MDGKVLNLLRLCLIAKEHGIPVWFSWSPHVNGIYIHALKEGWEDVPQDEIPEREFSYNIYLDFDDAKKQIAEAGRSIRELIEKRGKKE